MKIVVRFIWCRRCQQSEVPQLFPVEALAQTQTEQQRRFVSNRFRLSVRLE